MTVLLIVETCIIALFIYLLFMAGKNATEANIKINSLQTLNASLENENNFYRRENHELRGQIEATVRVMDEAEIELTNAKATIKEQAKMIYSLQHRKDNRKTLKGKK